MGAVQSIHNVGSSGYKQQQHQANSSSSGMGHSSSSIASTPTINPGQQQQQLINRWVRPAFHAYYEWRRRYKQARRRVAFRPGRTYFRLQKVAFLRKVFVIFVVWHFLGRRIIHTLFKEEVDILKSEGQEFADTDFSEVWSMRVERFNRQATDDHKYKTALHKMLQTAEFQWPSVRRARETTFPQDDV